MINFNYPKFQNILITFLTIFGEFCDDLLDVLSESDFERQLPTFILALLFNVIIYPITISNKVLYFKYSKNII